jgi:hypothetical protein
VKGLAGGTGLFQRHSALDVTQQLLGLAVKTIAGVAANDFRPPRASESARPGYRE